MKKIIFLGTFILCFGLNAQNSDNDNEVIIGKVDGEKFNLVIEDSKLINLIEDRFEIQKGTYETCRIEKFKDGVFLQLFTKDGSRLSTDLDIKNEDIVLIGRVSCTTTACYLDAGNCQPQYGNTCSACPNGDCKTQILISQKTVNKLD